MLRVTAEDAMQAALSQVKELAEICDSQGRILGYFAPVCLEHAAAYAEGAAHFDPAEITSRKEQKQPGHSTKEVLEHLKSLEKT
jgi:hypothetical protein